MNTHRTPRYSQFIFSMLLMVLSVATVSLLSYSSAVSAQPGATPPTGNVDANFYTVTATNNAPVPASAGTFTNNNQASGIGITATGFKGIVGFSNSLGVNGIGGEFHGNHLGVWGVASAATGEGGSFSNTFANTYADLATSSEAIYAQGDVRIDGHLRMQTIGYFHTATAGTTASVSVGNSNSSVVACPANHILLSCGYKLCANGSATCTDAAAGLYKVAPNKEVIDDANNQCIVGVQSYDTTTRYFAAQARCFNPNF